MTGVQTCALPIFKFFHILFYKVFIFIHNLLPPGCYDYSAYYEESEIDNYLMGEFFDNLPIQT